jgi:DNA-binding LacI/PurR family transcriptional regulator
MSAGDEGKVSTEETVVNLRCVANRVGLAPCSVSAILNQTAAARAIPQKTQERVFRAAAELNYQPNLSARSLRTKRTQMIALLSKNFAGPEIGQVISRTEQVLRERGYLLVLGSVDGPSEWPRLSILLRQRGVEGLIVIGMTTPRELSMPTVSVLVGTYSPDNDSAAVSELADSAIHRLLTKIEGDPFGKVDAPSCRKSSFVSVEHADSYVPKALD